ncbi:ATP-binding protein [Colwellia hornerae]|uniref:histidine kinase n=1 Tax=Colwellia hornerae TaxID=89402 RepID=A0A5C6QRM7_9GAMM|nr:ATP-binding protein [Colwellia hornerae]TWX55719.1 response regulator [Colwellia hornerae]TWX61929.1 response regulator [Colwellia hornerae]TWX71261.1 response regulator [Colwellia hornerae]
MIAFKRIVYFFIVIIVQTSFFSSAVIAAEQSSVRIGDQKISQDIEILKNIEDDQQAVDYSKSLLTRSSLTLQQTIAILQIQEKHYYQLRDLRLALASAQRVQLLATDNNLKKIAADADKTIGIYHYLMGEYSQSITASQASLSYYINSAEPLRLAGLYNNLALAYIDLGDTSKTLVNFQLAETIYNKFGTKQDQIDVRYNIAGLYLRLKRYDVAIELYLDVIAQLPYVDDKITLAKAQGELGTVYKYSGEYQKALKLLLQAIAYFEQSNNTYYLASFSHNIAGLYNMMNQPINATKYATQAINLGKASDHKTALAGGLYSLAQAEFSLGYVEKSYQNLLLSDEIAKQMGHEEQITNNMALLALIYAAQNKQSAAFATHQEYIKRTRKIANNQLNSQLSDFESKKLRQEVSQLKQNKQLQALETEQADQQRNFSLVAACFIIVLVLFILNRNIEKRSKLKLSERVKNRTQELELLTSELVKANAIKSQFLANMSHEIRTPLTSIIGQAEAIINGDIDEGHLHKEVKIIHGNSLHLLELINNILDLSRVEANKLELELVEQDLQVILHDIANIFIKSATVKGLQFQIVHTLPSKFLLTIDGFRLKQILINLCSNAIKFTNKGSVTLDISVKNAALTIAVSDTGIGMSETQLQQVFTSFTQGDSSISRRFGGSGLGLCLSEQLAKLMSGKISVTSTLNKGSTFTLVLPCKQLESIQLADIPPTKIVACALTAVARESKFEGQVLLADDHDDNRRLIARLLTSLGLEVLSASNGREAVELCLKSNPNLILMDIQMPEMDGIEAFKVLRQKGCLRPIVALTANAMSHEVDKYLALGFDGHLKKPIERKLFIATIAKYFGEKMDESAAERVISTVDMSDLVTEFKSNLVLEQQDIILHIKNNELEKLAELAHRIAGAAQMFGFSLVSVSAIKLEKNIKSESSQLISEAAQSLLNEIDQVLW